MLPTSHYLQFFVAVFVALRLAAGQTWSARFCTLANGERGRCSALEHCQSAKNELYAGVRPIYCGNDRNIWYVCCESEPVTTTTTNQPPIRINWQPGDTRISQTKCLEYQQEAVYVRTVALNLKPGAQPIVQETANCGHSSTSKPGIGGGQAELREFPYSALLGYLTVDNKIAWECGGSLISKRFVITAGHCLNSTNHGAVRNVLLGDYDISTTNDDTKHKIYEIESRIAYPNYTNSIKYNDIALLKLHRLVTLTPFIIPICLPETSYLPDELIATGWGTVGYGGRQSETLLKVTLETYPHSECYSKYRNSLSRKLSKGINETTQFCAGWRDDMEDIICGGDSGGPLIMHHPEIFCMYTQVGISSFGYPCGQLGVPGVYTDVYAFIDWIENIVWPYGHTDE